MRLIRRENSVILSGAVRRSRRISVALSFVLFFTAAVFAAPKSASAYYSDAAFQYIENRLPSAEITCNEGLQYYPNDQKLQMLLDRIHEAKDEQKNENKKNDKNQDNNQDQNKDQNKDQNQDQNQDQQNQDQNQNGDGQSSSSESDQNQDQQNQDQNQDQNGENGQSSDSKAESSDSNEGGAGQQPEQQPEGESSDSNGGEEPQEQPVQMGEMSPEDAAQLLKDFDEQNGERKPWKPIRGQARPAKDW